MPDFTASDTEFRKRIRTSFDRQSMMATLGARLARVEPGEVEIELGHAPHILQQHGFIHGGAVTAIADSAAGYAALTSWVTSNFKSPLGALATHGAVLLVLSMLPRFAPFSALRFGLDVLT